MAAVRAVALLAARVASEEGLVVLHVLLAAVRARARLPAAHPTSTADDAAAVAAACALVAVRHGAAAGKYLFASITTIVFFYQPTLSQCWAKVSH